VPTTLHASVLPAKLCIGSMKHDLHTKTVQCAQPPAILQIDDRIFLHSNICCYHMNELA
jgi:hypothetical protein